MAEEFSPEEIEAEFAVVLNETKAQVARLAPIVATLPRELAECFSLDVDDLPSEDERILREVAQIRLQSIRIRQRLISTGVLTAEDPSITEEPIEVALARAMTAMTNWNANECSFVTFLIRHGAQQALEAVQSVDGTN